MKAKRWRLDLGRWQDQEWPEAEAMITDPPYSPKTHAGARTSAAPGPFVDYASITPGDAELMAERFAPLLSGWAVIFCDHLAYQWHAQAWESRGWYVFAPVGWVKRNPVPRLQGDGPTTSIEWIMVARPRARVADPGSRPGHYLISGSTEAPGTRRAAGHKPPIALGGLIKGYTTPGSKVLDPFAGTGTVGAAALRRGRMYVGSEVDPDTHAQGVERLGSVQPTLPGILDPFAFTQADLGL